MTQQSAEQAWAAQLIRSARLRHGFDVHWAAGLLGVSPAYLLMVETGMTSASASLCRRVVATLNVPAAEARELLAAVGAVEEVKSWSHV